MKLPHVAVMTMSRNEKIFFPLWLGYYSRFIPANGLFVLDHLTEDGSLDRGYRCEGGPAAKIDPAAMNGAPFVRIPVHDKHVFNEKWRCDTVFHYQELLFSLGYEAVLFTDTDEIIVPDPEVAEDLGAYLEKFLSGNAGFVNCTGYELIHDREKEAAMDFSRPVLAQRGFWYKNFVYDKPLLARRGYSCRLIFGFHRREDELKNPDPGLLLLHLHKMDYELVRARHRHYVSRVHEFPKDQHPGVGKQYRWEEDFEAKFEIWWKNTMGGTIVPVPGRFAGVI